MRTFLVLLLLPLGSGHGMATATLTCGIDDRNLNFQFLGNVGRGDGAAVQIVEGSLAIKAVRGQHGGMEFAVEPAHLIQHWAFEKELRLGVQPAEKNGVTVYLAIVAQEARRTNDTIDLYRGRYVLKIQGPKGASELRGRIKSCAAG